MNSLIKVISAIVLVSFGVSGCCDSNSEEAKMFEIAQRQMEFNDFTVMQINGLVEADTTRSETKLDVAKHCNEFHKNILEFQTRIKDQSVDQKALRSEINDYLDRFLQEVNPELSHESFLDGAISRGLLAIELSYIEKSFLDDQEHRANQ